MDDLMENTLRRVRNSVCDAKINAVKAYSEGIINALDKVCEPGDMLTPAAVKNLLTDTAREYELMLLREKE